MAARIITSFTGIIATMRVPLITSFQPPLETCMEAGDSLTDVSGYYQQDDGCKINKTAGSQVSLVEKLPSFVKLVSPFRKPINQHFW